MTGSSLLDQIVAADAGAEPGPRRRTVTENDIVWEIVDEKTGEARRLTPLTKSSALRTPSKVVRFFPPEATTGPAQGRPTIPVSVRNIVVLGMLSALLNQNKQSLDAARRWIDSSFGDVSAEVRAEVVAMWDRKRFG